MAVRTRNRGGEDPVATTGTACPPTGCPAADGGWRGVELTVIGARLSRDCLAGESSVMVDLVSQEGGGNPGPLTMGPDVPLTARTVRAAASSRIPCGVG